MSYFSFGIGVKDVSAKATDQEIGSDDKVSDDDVKDSDDSNSEDKDN